MSDLPRRLLVSGVIYLGASVTLVVTRAPLGSPIFFVCCAAASLAYLLALRIGWRQPEVPRRWLLIAFLFALAFRLPLALSPVGADSDMVRYIWDGRVQHLGYNPYTVVPADPLLAHTHSEDTRQMPSIRARTPYPPGAQLFFRLVVSFSESPLAMKLALLACDLLTIAVLWRWLETSGRSPWLTLVYAWNPLVILEVAHGGHIDALGALWIAASAFFLTRRRTLLASIALVLAIATKLLPVVLAPLYWRRIRWIDGVIAAALLGALYGLFTAGNSLPLGAIPNVVAHIRFNGPIFRALATTASPTFAAAAAVLLGVAAAMWARRRLAAADPAAWAWPMAISLAAAPVIYPWYLLYLTPFLWSRTTIPLLTWTFSVLPIYLVWEWSRHGHRWRAPASVELLEFGAVIASIVIVIFSMRRSGGSARPMDELH